jgi:hypothetical protein
LAPRLDETDRRRTHLGADILLPPEVFATVKPCSVVSRLPDAPLCAGATHALFLVQELPVHSLITPDVADQDHRQAWLSAQLTAPVTLIWTENRSSMLSARGNAKIGYQVRLHHMFLQAPDGVWCALVAYLRNADATASRTIRQVHTFWFLPGARSADPYPLPPGPVLRAPLRRRKRRVP